MPRGAFAARLAAAFRAAVLGRRTGRPVPRRGPRRQRAARRLVDVQHRPPAGHRHARRRRGRRCRRAARPALASTAGTACARWPTTTRGTTRSATTPARCGRTTRPSPSTGWRGPATATSPAGWLPGCSPPRRTFDHRLPELYGGWPASAGPPLAYPASCRPQAWAAGRFARRAARRPRAARRRPGGHAHGPPRRRLRRPLPAAVTGLRVGQHVLDIHVDDAGCRHRRHDRTADARDLTPTVRPCSEGTCGCSPPLPTSRARGGPGT